MSNLELNKLSIVPYVPFHTLTGGHSDTVNTLAFSPDGAYLASGGDDHVVIIWKVSEGRLLYRSMHSSAIDTIIWHPLHSETIIVGCESGWLFQMHEFSLHGATEHEICLGTRSTVHCLDYDVTTRYLAIGLGDEVHLTYEASQHVYRGDIKLPSPPDHPDLDELEERRLRAVYLRFNKDGKQLIVSYLAHGIICWNVGDQTQLWAIPMPSATPSIGGVAISPDGHDIIVYNLVNGLDCYASSSSRGSRLLYKFDSPPRSNHHLKICYVHGGTAVACGTMTGNVCVWNAVSGDIFQLLAHDDDIVQAISASMTSKACYIAAGSAAKGQATYIKIWKAGLVLQKDSAPDISDVMVDVVRAVTSNHLYQPRDGIRQGITIAFTAAVCFSFFWALVLVPWFSIWDVTVVVVHFLVKIVIALGSSLWENGVVVGGQVLKLSSVAGEKLTLARASVWAWVLDALRSALCEFLFPTNAVLRALDPVVPIHDVPFYANGL